MSSGLNNWENHRLQSEFENNMIVKKITFLCINSFISLFLIAFILPSIPQLDSHYSSDPETKNKDILVALRLQLASPFFTLIVIQNCQEVLLPPILNWIYAKMDNTNDVEHLDARRASQPNAGD